MEKKLNLKQRKQLEKENIFEVFSLAPPPDLS